MKRRKFFGKMGVGFGFGILGAHIALADSKVLSKKSLKIALLNDLHHGSSDCDEWFRGVVEAVREEEPDFCALAGDLADKGLESSLRSVKTHFERLSCPVYPVPGNHDCDVTQDTSLYEEVFPGRVNYLVEEAGWQFLFLDTTEGKAWENTRISSQTLTWLRHTVEEMNAHVPTLVVSHFPLASPIHMAPLNVAEVWAILREVNVRGAFCGHFHGQHTVMNPPLVTTNVCCSRIRENFDKDPRKGFWILRATPAGVLDYRLKQIDF